MTEILDAIERAFSGTGSVGLAVAIVFGAAFLIMGLVGLFVPKRLIVTWPFALTIDIWTFFLFVGLVCLFAVGVIVYFVPPA